MMFQKSPDKTQAAPCQACLRIRAFLIVSLALIIAVPLLGEKIAPIAELTPMNIALSIVGIGGLAFVARWVAWRRQQAHAPQDIEIATKTDVENN